MKTIKSEKFIELFAEEGKELFNGDVACKRVTAPLDDDITMWVERDIMLVEIDIVEPLNENNE